MPTDAIVDMQGPVSREESLIRVGQHQPDFCKGEQPKRQEKRGGLWLCALTA